MTTPIPPTDQSAAPPDPGSQRQAEEYAYVPPPLGPAPTGLQYSVRPNSGLAVASLVLGLCGVVVSWFTFGIPSLLALIFGIVGIRQTTNRQREGRGLAIAGTTLGAVMLLLGAYVSVVVLYGIGQAANGLASPAGQVSAAALPTAGDSTYLPTEAAPTEAPPTEAPAVTAMTVGTPVSVGNEDGSVDAVVTVVSAKTYKAGKGEFADPPKNGRYVVVDVLVSVKRGTLSYNPFDWSYQHPDGTVYSYGDGNSVFAGYNPQFNSGDLRTGQKTRGLITFDVKYVRGGSVQYTAGDTVIAEWTV